MEQNSFTFALDNDQQDRLLLVLSESRYTPVTVPHTLMAVKAEGCSVSLYTSGKCLVQGKGAQDFVLFVLEPLVLQRVQVGYETVLDPARAQPHMGIDESGKGDFFGPIVICAAYADAGILDAVKDLDVKDSKKISSDKKAVFLGAELRRRLGRERYSIVKIGPAAYNKLYAKLRNVNTLLAWAHARAIENLLETTPSCPRAISDQFGSKQQVERALMNKGRKIVLEQMPRAESDPAVAMASIIAREQFLRSLKALSDDVGVDLPKGASEEVRNAAVAALKKLGAPKLVELAKCHFKTADQVLAAVGAGRDVLGEFGQAVSKPMTGFRRKSE